jgi:hypothetical protein
VNRSERLQALLRLEGLASAARALAAEHRIALNAEATAEYEREGAAPTWRLADLGTIILPVSHETPVVQDAVAFTAWCSERYPSEVETLAQIRPHFQATLLKRVQPLGEVVMDPATGEAIPGLGVRAGGIPKALTIRATPEAEAVFAAIGRRELADLLQPTGGEQ